MGGPVYSHIKYLMDTLKIVPTHSLIKEPSVQTYRHASLTAASLIDHFLVSTELVDSVENICVLDDGRNLSDHMPLVMLLSLRNSASVTDAVPSARKLDMQRLRWHKADLTSYYSLTYQYLSDVRVYLLTCLLMWRLLRASLLMLNCVLISFIIT